MCIPLAAAAAFAGIAGTVSSIAGGLSSAEDQEDVLHKQASISFQNAQHQKEVSLFNAEVLKRQADRLRNDQVGRINEVAGINIGRLTEVAGINIGRINEVTKTNVGRLEEQAAQTRQRGVEDENAVRRNTAEVISSQRATYAARGVVVDSGTPAAMQVDSARMGEVDALRVRRNYRIQAQEILQKADDLKRDANYMISDINRNTGYQVGDINRNTGYDLSDIEFEASKLDQQAALTILSGDAALSAGLNQSDAYQNAAADMKIAGVLAAAGGIASGINPKWFVKDSAAISATPVVESVPTYTRS